MHVLHSNLLHSECTCIADVHNMPCLIIYLDHPVLYNCLWLLLVTGCEYIMAIGEGYATMQIPLRNTFTAGFYMQLQVQ